MATFQDIRDQAEQKVMVGLLGEIERNEEFTQRRVAQELGIALGLMNQYLKRAVTKGWVRASKASSRRIKYFLTPEGFAQKSKMVANYLSRSLTFFREAREQCEEALMLCQQNDWKRIALIGAGDLANIVLLIGKDMDFELVVVKSEHDLEGFDAGIITDIARPQRTYDKVKGRFLDHRIITLKLLQISRDKSCLRNS